MITTNDIKLLRQKTGAGVLDCREALTASGGNVDAALETLRAKSTLVTEKRADRAADEGYIATYDHGGRVGVLVDVRCETDFVSANAGFRELAREIALQVAAQNPRWISREDVPEATIQELQAEERSLALAHGKSEQVVERIVSGKVERLYRDSCLLEQPYIRDDKETIGGLIQDKIVAFGEKIVVRRFARFDIAE